MKLFHNTKIIERIGDSFLVEYKDKRFRLIFDERIHDNDDGLHILDYFTVYDQTDDPKFSDIEIKGGEEELDIISKFVEITKDKEGWIINILRAEKVICKDTRDGRDNHVVLDRLIRQLANHHVLCDNIIIGDDFRGYEHIHYPLTNVLFQWDNLIQLNIFREFSKIYDNLRYPYDIGYSVRNHKTFRNKLLNSLSSIPNQEQLFLSRNTFYENDKFYLNGDSILNDKDNIIKIDSNPQSDFEKNESQITHLGNDLLFDVLSQSKMVVLDESWVFKPYDYHSQYLSEKTFILLLTKKPFISTHSYPLDILHKILDIPRYPNYNEIKECQGDIKKLTSFVNNFLSNFDSNYKIHKQWIDEVHDVVMERVRRDNSLFDYIKNFKPNRSINKVL
jgi:hypothetical protein